MRCRVDKSTGVRLRWRAEQRPMPMSLHLHINITKEKIMKRVRSMTRMVAAMLYIAFAKLSVQTPAQAAMVGTGVVVAVLLFLVLLVTDILGFTDIFPFVKKRAR